MRVLIFGGNGMLGHKLVQVLSEMFDVQATSRGRFSEFERFGIFDKAHIAEGIDVTNFTAVRGVVESFQPDVLINAAGVIKQLPTSKDVIKTLTVNSIFPNQLAVLSKEIGFRLICISTDCVFDGKRGNYKELDDANALDLYGRSKNLGEVTDGNCLTLRTSIIGRELGTSHSLIEWFLGNRGKTVNGFRKAIYSGFPTVVLADILSGVISDHPNLNGLFHVSSDPIDKFSLLQLVNERYNAGVEIIPSDEFVIDRSLDSTKFRTLTGFVPESWEMMVDRMASDPTNYDK